MVHCTCLLHTCRRPAGLDAQARPAEAEFVMSAPELQTVSATEASASEAAPGSAQKSRVTPVPLEAAAVVYAGNPASPEQKRRTPRKQKAPTDGDANAAKASAKASKASAEAGDETAVGPPSIEKKKPPRRPKLPRRPKDAGNNASEDKSTESAVAATDHVEAEGNSIEASAAKPKRKRTTQKTKTVDVVEPSEDGDAATAGGDDAAGGLQKPAKKARAKKVEWPPGTYPSRLNATAVCEAEHVHGGTAGAQSCTAESSQLQSDESWRT